MACDGASLAVLTGSGLQRQRLPCQASYQLRKNLLDTAGQWGLPFAPMVSFHYFEYFVNAADGLQCLPATQDL